jgi:hypothetical protein
MGQGSVLERLLEVEVYGYFFRVLSIFGVGERADSGWFA